MHHVLHCTCVLQYYHVMDTTYRQWSYKYRYTATTLASLIPPLTSFFASIKASKVATRSTQGGLQIETTPFQLKRTSISAARQPQAPESIWEGSLFAE